MTYAIQFIFNLILNATCSFFAGLSIVYICIRVFRVDHSRWKVFLLSLPFVKIIWDLIYRGIPTSSIVHAGINPLALPPQHQTLTIGTGISEYGPVFNLVFTAKSLDGKIYSTSFADYIYAWTAKYFGGFTPRFILGSILLISSFFVLRRIWVALRFEQNRIKHRSGEDTLGIVRLDFRSVDIYCSEKYSGTPFTGGFFRPYICIPKKALSVLDPNEKSAVIQHEIAHIRHWDLFVTLAIKSLGDFFWFVPGYKYLSKRIDRLREILADNAAVKAGSSAPHLASALLKLQDIPEDYHHAVLHSAFFREKSLLKIRIESLLGKKESDLMPRLGWNIRLMRVLIVGWTTGAVMIATFGGNHEVKIQEVPKWIENFLRGLGF